MHCEHIWQLKDTARIIYYSDSSNRSRCQTWVLTDTYYCQKCLKEENRKKEWCGHDHYADRPYWTKVGKWEKVKTGATRKSMIAVVLLFLCHFSLKAQVHDGITQPVKFRFLLPVNTSLHGKGSAVAPFAGYRMDVSKRFTITPVVQYNMNTESILTAVWMNLNYREKLYFLSRTILNTRTGRFEETLSSTMKLPGGYMIDSTWENIFRDYQRWQIVGGWDHKRIVVNVGYVIHGSSGIVANFRFKVTPYNWLQMKYDAGMKSVTTSVVLQIGSL